MSRFSRVAVTLAAAAVMVFAACGGDDDGDEKDDFIAEADALCVENAQSINELTARLGTPQSIEEGAAFGAEALVISEQSLDDLSELEAPEELADEYDEYLAQRESFVDLLRQRQAADEAGDDAASQEVAAQLEGAADARDAAAEEVGFESCAEVLPEDQVEDVTTVMEETAINGDPAHCTEDYTENFVENTAGGLEACQATEQDTANQAESVDIGEVRGMDETYAFADVTFTGGPADGQTLRVEAVFEDDRWKIDGVSQAP